ncbi:hypothetical protein CR513_01143, partial [Mucuna pruriens]
MNLSRFQEHRGVQHRYGSDSIESQCSRIQQSHYGKRLNKEDTWLQREPIPTLPITREVRKGRKKSLEGEKSQEGECITPKPKGGKETTKSSSSVQKQQYKMLQMSWQGPYNFAFS